MHSLHLIRKRLLAHGKTYDFLYACSQNDVSSLSYFSQVSINVRKMTVNPPIIHFPLNKEMILRTLGILNFNYWK